MPTIKTVATLIGNPRSGGRTSQVAATVADVVARGIGRAAVLEPVELGAHGPAVLAPTSPAVDHDRVAIANADVVVVASATYKATYTGLLKSFLDRFDGGSLTNVTAIPVMVGGSPRHALAVEVHLRPLLVELGAMVPGPGLYVLDWQLDDLDAVVREWWDASGPAVCAATLCGGAV